MTDLTGQYQSKPLPIEATRITRDNIKQVMEWCNGTLWSLTVERFSITIPRVFDSEVTALWGRYGDWIVKDVDGKFYIYTPEVFKDRFEPAGINDPEPEYNNDPSLFDLEWPHYDR